MSNSVLKKSISFAISLITVSATFVAPANAADPLGWTSASGYSVLNWSGSSTVSNQTGWRLSWKKKTETTFDNYYDINSVSTRTANVCMSYTGSEENYQIQPFGASGLLGSPYINTWTYTGVLYTAVSPKPSCVNPNEYNATIAFNNNGGSGTMTSMSVFGSSTTLTANTFTKSASPNVFLNWNTLANGTGTTYSNSATLNFSVAAPPATLYAQWGYSLTATQGANGTISPSTTNVISGSNQTFTFTPSAGYAVSSITIDGTALSGTALTNAIASGYTFSNVTANHTVTASYAVSSSPSISPTSQTISGTTNSAITSSTAFTPSNYSGAVTYSVTTGSVPAGLSLNTSTGVISGTPTAVSSATITITGTSGAESSTSNVTFNITAPISTPTISGISPSSGTTAGGTSITITGTNFAAGATVSVGGAACTAVVVVSATSITCTTPAGSAGAKDVVVTNSDTGSTTNSGGFTYVVPAPTITSLSVTTGTTGGGTTTTITGTNLTGTTAVTVGGNSATGVTVNSATSVTITTPSGTAGAKNVVITTPGGSATAAGAFTYSASISAPTISGISPSSGTTAGGTSITITGTGFLTGATVTVGGAACTVTSVTSTSITCTTPAGSAGAKDVLVTNTDGGSTTSSGGFTYVAPTSTPTISGISPSSGTTAGGTSITITGTGFLTGATVTVGGAACTVTSVTSTSITCTTPTGSAEAKDVVVTNTDGGHAESSGGFTYTAESGGGNNYRNYEPAEPVKKIETPKIEVKSTKVEVEKKEVKPNQILATTQNISVELPKNSTNTQVIVNGSAVNVTVSSTGEIKLPGIVGPKDKIFVSTTTAEGEVISSQAPAPTTPISIGNVNFDLSASKLTPKAKAELDKVINLIKIHGFTTIALDGHADALGAGKFNNLALSTNRSKSVAAYLETQLANIGVKVTYNAYGDKIPVASNTSKYGQALNRRVEIKVS